jgi:DNA polymerase-3 subunit delta'
VIPFFNLGQEETAEILMRERPEIDRETANLLARLSEGCPGQALLLYRRELIAIRQEVVALLSDPEIDENRDVALLLKAAETMADLKEDLLPLLGLLRIWIRDLLMVDSPGRRGDAPSAPGRKQPEDKRKCWSSPQLFDKLQAIDQAEKELGRNCNRTMVCEVLLFRLQH